MVGHPGHSVIVILSGWAWRRWGDILEPHSWTTTQCKVWGWGQERQWPCKLQSYSSMQGMRTMMRDTATHKVQMFQGRVWGQWPTVSRSRPHIYPAWRNTFTACMLLFFALVPSTSAVCFSHPRPHTLFTSRQGNSSTTSFSFSYCVGNVFE